MKELRKLSIWMLIAMLTLPVMTSCSKDNDEEDAKMSEYAGSWKCISPDSWRTATIVTKGTLLEITSTGDATWTLPDNTKYTAKMRNRGDDWVIINYNGKSYTAEMYVRSYGLTINANGNAKLEVKDFPFDGSYEKVK